MNEQAQKVLAELLNKAAAGIDSAVAFSQAQLPDVVHQLLVWNATSSLLFQILAVLVIAGYLFSLKKAVEVAGGYSAFNTVAAIYIVAGGIASAVMFVGFWFSFAWLKIWLAPKLYLIEYAARLMAK